MILMEIWIKNNSRIIQEYGSLKIKKNIFVEFSDIKKYLSYIPLKSKSNEFDFTHPLGKIKKSNGNYVVFIANKSIATLKLQYFKISALCLNKYMIFIDKNLTKIKKASYFYVNDAFKILSSENTRVNVIGYYTQGTINESDILIDYLHLNKKFLVV